MIAARINPMILRRQFERFVTQITSSSERDWQEGPMRGAFLLPRIPILPPIMTST
jgi:hypothetical protein